MPLTPSAAVASEVEKEFVDSGDMANFLGQTVLKLSCSKGLIYVFDELF